MTTNKNAQQSTKPQSNDNPVDPTQSGAQKPPEKRSRWGLSDKTFWDWLQLLIVPFIIAVGGFWFTAQQNNVSQQNSIQQHNSDQAIAQDQQRATILQAYMDTIQELLIHDNLEKSKPTDGVAILARSRTMKISLRRL